MKVRLPSVSTTNAASRRAAESEDFRGTEAGRRNDLVARSGIVITLLILAWYTWARWGDVRIDCGRELYVPAAILDGKLLYRDLWYPYGPLAPYYQAMLFRLFGVHLNVVYLFGLSLTLTFALLLFALGRRFLPTSAAFLVSFCFLTQGFHPSMFNYVFPYSHAASMGSLLGLAFLYFLVRHILGEPGPNLLVAGFGAGLALLCKQEFGVACYLVLAFVVPAHALAHRSARRFAADLLRCVPGLLVCGAVYGWFIWRLSPRLILLENFQSAPNSYFMRTFGARWISRMGLRFDPPEVLKTAAFAVGSLAVWFVLAAALRYAFNHRRVWPAVAAAIGLGVAGYALDVYLSTYIFPRLVEQIVFPRGMFWLACLLLAWEMKDFLRGGFARRHLAMVAVAAYALAAGVRIMVLVIPEAYAIFYNSTLFLAFIIVVTRVIKWAARGLKIRQQAALLNGLLALEGLGFAFLAFPHPQALPAPLITDLGTIYTRPAEAALFPQIISFMREQRALGKRVVVLPEEVSLYFFSGTEAPSRWYQLIPGMIDPAQEDQYVAQLESRKVDYILLSNRSTYEYGVPFFGLDYDRRVYRWIETNYEVVGEFGSFSREKSWTFAMLVYKRRDETPPTRF